MSPFGEVNSPLRPVLGRPVSPDNPAALTGDGFPQTVEGAGDPSPATIQYVHVDHQVSETCFGGDARLLDGRVQRWLHRRRWLSGTAALGGDPPGG